MIHNETANIWTHIVGLAIFVVITTSMAFGWGGAPMAALPDTWITGANATRVVGLYTLTHSTKAPGFNP
jgi:predicted membrane channel-forming protein YqfA (hemolysin III family)